MRQRIAPECFVQSVIGLGHCKGGWPSSEGPLGKHGTDSKSRSAGVIKLGMFDCESIKPVRRAGFGDGGRLWGKAAWRGAPSTSSASCVNPTTLHCRSNSVTHKPQQQLYVCQLSGSCLPRGGRQGRSQRWPIFGPLCTGAAQTACA
jgi:hypothetical protein